MSFDWVSTVPEVKNGETTLDANGINPSIQALTDRTNTLKQRLDNLSGTCGLVYTDIGFDSTVAGIGTLLAWDGKEKKYIPAAAAWDGNSIRDNGSLIPADSSYVVGILVSDVDSDGRATIMAHGWTTEASVISAVTGDNPIPGQYYLNTDGRAVRAEDGGLSIDLPVYCFTLTASGKLVFNPKAPEQYGHSHGRYTLNNWEAVAEDEAPTGMLYKYVPQDGEFLATALKNYPKSCVLIKNGMHLQDDDWTVANGTVFVKFMPQLQDEILLYITTPTFGYQPLVHSVAVERGCKIIETTNSSGNVTLKFNDKPIEESVLSGTVVTAINRDGVKTGPAIQQLYSGPGIDIAPAVDAGGSTIPGGWQIGATSSIKDHRDLQVCNLDGVLFGVDDDKVSYKFPSACISALYGTVRLPHFSPNAAYKATLNVIISGCVNGYPDVAATLTPINATAEGGARIPGVDVNVPCSRISGRDSGKDYLVTVELEEHLIKTDQLMLCKLLCNNTSAAPLTVLGVSIALQ